MAGIWISIAAKIVEYLVEPILNQFDYLINFNDNVEDLTKQVEKLEAIKLKVKQLIEIARRNAEDIKLDVERWLSNVDEIIQCPKIKHQLEYLRAVFSWFEAVSGLKINLSNSSSISIWDPILEKMERRLAGWKRLYLSKGGKLTLLKSTLSNLPAYFLSLFPLPVGVAAKIERIQRDFLWSGLGDSHPVHLVKWNIVCEPIQNGGLGVKNLRRFNQALLGRGPYGVSLWKFIRQGWDHLFPFLSFKVGNGERVRFWYDVWCGDGPLKVVFPGLFSIAGDRNASVANLMSFRNGCDTLCWQRKSKEGFTVKSFYQSLSSSPPRMFPWKGVWNPRVPPRVAFFLWATVLGKILTAENLRKRHIIINVRELVEGWHVSNHHQTRIWNAVPHCLMWSLWRERNSRIFEDRELNIDDLKLQFFQTLFEWMQATNASSSEIEPSHRVTELRSRAKTISRSEPRATEPRSEPSSHDPTKPSRDLLQAKIQATEPLSQDPSHRAEIRAKPS
uniref:Reverse transcriptase zinc-binding domain-containing protein n=1 Tax=Fagus sylvatica TaxID=28930 RepID=A0A2N9FFY4_FAGSY